MKRCGVESERFVRYDENWIDSPPTMSLDEAI